MILGRFEKQPNETLDYYILYADWFSNRVDVPASFDVTTEPGITVVGTPEITGTTGKIILAGGTAGVRYKITATLTTDSSPAIIKEVDFMVKVKES